jgi:chromosome segregation ATPase
MAPASDTPTTGPGGLADPTPERRIEELESELAATRRDLWSVRDALIGSQAEHATLKVRFRELEVHTAQLQQRLDEQDTLHRAVGRIRRDPRVRAVGRRLRTLAGRPPSGT